MWQVIKNLITGIPALIQFIRSLLDDAKERDTKARESEAQQRREQKINDWDAAVDAANVPLDMPSVPSGMPDPAVAPQQSGSVEKPSGVPGSGQGGAELRQGGRQDDR